MQNRSVVIQWNNTFPLDRWWRKKYSIPFNSKQHREISQIDIYLEWLEDQVFEEHEEETMLRVKKMELYNKGEWITSDIEIDEKKSDQLFDDIQI